MKFAYDSLGRRIYKKFKKTFTNFVWDGNVPLHEWKSFETQDVLTDKVITWIFEEDSYSPVAKLYNGKTFSIINDQLGTPIEGYSEEGDLIWERELNSNGKVLKQTGKANFCPFLYQGQSYDPEIALAYNRFRYYDPEDGRYISQDPIGLLSGEFGFYNYVEDTNGWIDVFGLAKSYANPKRNKKTSHNANSRKAALRQAKRDAGIPMSQRSKKVYHTDLLNGNKTVKDKNGAPVQTRNYEFVNSKGETITIQEHSLGHIKAEPNHGAEPHFNVRDSNLDTGSVNDTHGHYNF